MSAAPEDPDVGPETAQRVDELGNGWGVFAYINADGQNRYYVRTNSGTFLQPDGTTGTQRRTYTESQLRSAIEKAVQPETKSWDSIEDIPAYEIKNDGIDFNRDGVVTPWEETPWSGGIDFQESTRTIVDTIEVAGRKFDVRAEPDPLNRGDGNNYDVLPKSGSATPRAFEKTMTTMDQVRDAFEQYVENVKTELEEQSGGDEDGLGAKIDQRKVETLPNEWDVWTFVYENGQTFYIQDGTEFLRPDGSFGGSYEFETQEALQKAVEKATEDSGGGSDGGSSDENSSSGQSGGGGGMERVEELGYGWVLVLDRGGGDGEGTVGTHVMKYYVLGRDETGRIYLESDGATTSDKTSFASKKRARQAFRRWRDENVAQKRAEANEARKEQSDEFQEALNQQSTSDGEDATVNVTTESTDPQVVTETETSGSGGSGYSGPGATSPSFTVTGGVSSTETAGDGENIPAVAIAAVGVVLILLLR